MSVTEAVHETDRAVVVDIEVVPGASVESFPAGFNVWRKRIQACVQAPAQDGKANEALLRLVARFFGVPTGAVTLESGATTRQKRLRLVGIDAPTVRQRLEAALA